MKKLYAIPNYECNLSCSFCDLHKRHCEYNHNMFVEVLNRFDGDITLFGGEPTLFKERYLELINTGKITSVTTNLIDIDEEILTSFKTVSLATSWTPERFCNKKCESGWLENLAKASQHNNDIRLLITLSHGTLEIPPKNMIKKLTIFDEYVKSILFEYLVDEDNNDEYYDSADKWLTEVNSLWKANIKSQNVIVEQVKHGWNFNCTETFTLLPDGTMRKGCPQFTKHNILEKCYRCDKATHCRPCILQHKCTYPHRLAESVLNDGKK